MESKKVIYVLILMLFMQSCSMDRKKIIVDNKQGVISVISDDYVIDSISIERYGKLFYSKSLKDKLEGKREISFFGNEDKYHVDVDNMETLSNNEIDLNLDIIIRKKGSTVKVTEDIANNFKHHEDIQVLRGIKYIPYSKEINTYKTDHFRR